MSIGINDFQLIQTKLNHPRTETILVARPRLLEQLSRHPDRPLVLISAPAGYGKTTLVSAWLKDLDRPSAWLSLDEHDNDPSLFLRYLLGAINTIFPRACRETAGILKASTLPPLPAIVRSLVNELNQIEQPYYLVLDDYHAINELAIHELLVELLRYPPSGMRLVLITRHNPLLPLSRWRGRGQMTEIRTQDLRFTTEEIAELLDLMVGTALDEVTVSLLEERIEGWVTGLRLVILSLRHRGDLDAIVAGLKGSSRYVVDYLLSEVLSQHPKALQAFLAQTSILGRLSGPLCNAVIESDDSTAGQSYLESVAAANLFLIPLDDQREWFRYHHLFQEFLQAQLKKETGTNGVAALHVRAANWFAQEGRFEEAIQHFLAAGDEQKAVQMVAESRHMLMNREQWQRLASWLRHFPDSVIEAQPILLISQAWLIQIGWRLEELEPALARVEAALNQYHTRTDAVTQIRAEVDTLRNIRSTMSGNTDVARSCLRHVLDVTPRDCYYVRGHATRQLGLTYQMMGDLDAAVDLAVSGLDEPSADPLYKSQILMMLCIVYWIAADLPKLTATANRDLTISRKHSLRLGVASGQQYLGCAYYQWNDLAAAEQCFSSIVDRRYSSFHGISFTNGVFGLALTHHALGRAEEADGVIDLAVDFLIEIGADSLLPCVEAFQAELALRQGRLGDAILWASRNAPLDRPMIMFHIFEPQLTLPKVWLAQDTDESRQRAAAVLDQLLDFVENTCNTYGLIRVLTLQSLLFQANGNCAAALNALERAVSLARPNGLIRLFLDIGVHLVPLLADLAQAGIQTDFIREILFAFDSENTSSPPPQPSKNGDTALQSGTLPAHVLPPTSSGLHMRQVPAVHLASSDLVESLTNREMDVLLLIAERLTNKEIAQELGISATTVKQHSLNLYRKLGVNNRRQAANRARQLAILPPA